MAPQKGDYCLATKWSDGEAWDHWAVGFYEGEIYPGRHSVVDSSGNRLRDGGFRRCEVISQEQGSYLLVNAMQLEACGTNLWDLLPTLNQPPVKASNAGANCSHPQGPRQTNPARSGAA
jgi:hypothetical protein